MQPKNTGEAESANDESRGKGELPRPGPEARAEVTSRRKPRNELAVYLRRDSLAKTLAYQFKNAATRALWRRPATIYPFERWTGVRTEPKPQRGLAAIKHARQDTDHSHHPHRPEPRGPADRGPMSLGELYLYYKAMGLLHVYFALYPQCY